MNQPKHSSSAPSSNHPWQRLTLTATLLGALVLSPMSAWSLTVGGMRVQSMLGEPLRAQLSLGELTPEEFSSITAGFAPAAVYAAAGIVANPVLSNVQISIDKSIASNVVLNITSNSPMSEPFLDMLLEIKWASGKVVRDYTLLFASAEQNTPLVSTEQVIVGAPSVSDLSAPLPLEAVVPSGVAVGAVVDAAPSVAQPQPRTTVAESAPTPTPPAQPAKSAPPVAAEEARTPANQRLRVVRGDTAAALAQANLPTGVSLDQMLQAMLRANPNAFVDGNVNRLKAGVELTLPDAQEAQSIDAAQARRLVVAQSRDFNAYRRTLAANAPSQTQTPAGQVASGQVETQVQDKAAADPVADQLTLSKGSVATGAEAEAQIAAAKQAQDEQAQQAELTRNIDELKALAESAPNAQGNGTAPADGAVGPTISPAPVATEVDTAAAPAEQAPSSEPPTMMQRLMAQPWSVPVAFGLLGLLLVLVVSRLTRRKKSQAKGPANVSAPGPAANDQRLTDAPSSGLTFNLDDIDLDLSPADVQADSDGANSEALFTKFELAKEFLSLGDRVAAKALAEEVQADATGLLKRRAELFLADLG